MSGPTLSKAYGEAFGQVMLSTKCLACKARIAAGRVGDGSECLDYDDALSRDHGPRIQDPALKQLDMRWGGGDSR